MAVDARFFIHEDDRAALEALEAIPGFTPFIKAFMKTWNESQFRILNMSSRVRLSEEQLPKYYAMLDPICRTLGIEKPELYLEMNVVPNAYTYGDSDPFIVLTSGLIECLPDELIPTVLAHECGHIACHHTLYRTMGQIILGSAAMLLPGIGALISLPLKIAFAYWMRCSEFSADRAAVICDGGPDKVIELCMRLSGYSKQIEDKASTDAFMKQALEYKELLKDNMLNQSLEFMLLAGQSHPLTAVRAYEANEWGRSDAVHMLNDYLSEKERGITPLRIPVAGGASSFVGTNKEETVRQLREAGFTAIEAERIKEISSGAAPGTVTAISIAGDSTFKALSWFPSDAPVAITFYEPLSEEELQALHPGEIRTPFSSASCVGRSWETVCKELVQAGFRDIVTVKTNAARPFLSREDAVKKITIADNESFEKGDWFRPDAPVRVTHFG